ncbi:MAG: LysR substrate-binding domain-containing protein, partial [Pseudomonadota bacterium]|nr:LysR substrate-binding domain-containing protein [Pseudomonadota bacterium]
TGYLRDWLHRGELHLAIMYQSPPARSLRVTPLLEERLHLVGPPGAGLSPARPVTAAEVAARRLFLPSPGHGLRALVETWAAAAGVALDVRVEADSYAILTALAETGPGCTLLPLAPIRREIAAGRLAHAPIADPAPRRRLELAMPADRAAPRLARFAAQALRDIAGDLVRGGQWSGRLIGGGEPDPAGGAAS